MGRDYSNLNRYEYAMAIRGELEDLMHDDLVISYMDLKYKTYAKNGIHIDDWSDLYDECSVIIKEAFLKAEKFDSL